MIKIINFVAIIIIILYSLLFFKMNKSKRNKKKGMVKYIKVLLCFIILIGLINVLANIGNKGKKESNSTTTTSNVVTSKIDEDEEVTTTVTSTTSTTQAKSSSSGTYKKLNHDLSGATDKGKTSKGYSIQVKNGITYVDGFMIANKTYSLPSSFNPGELDSTVLNAAGKMFAAAKSEKGYKMWAQSGFRSYSTQESIYNRYVSNDGKASADTYSARPGHSEHQTGLAFDVCSDDKPCITSGFNNTPQAKWLSENAWKYGFILRYVDGKSNETGYKYESWHFRYVGSDLAEKLYNNGNWITMEDYFGIDSKYND